MYSISETKVYKKWIKKLKNITARSLITERVYRAAHGLFGDVRVVGDGISELRIHYGPGYRVYFSIRGSEIIVLLCGGDKSTQDRDIVASGKLLKKLENKNGSETLSF